MSRQASRDAVKGALTAPRERQEKRRLSDFSVYERWCQLNGLLPVPPSKPRANYVGTEQIALLFLHAHHGRYAWGSARGMLLSIAQEHQLRGQSDFRGSRSGRYLRSLKVEFGIRKHRATDALTRDQVIAIADRADELYPMPLQVVRLRGVIAACEALGVNPVAVGRPAGPVQHLPNSAFEVRADEVWITVGDMRCALDRLRQPDFFAALVSALEAAGDAAQPLRPSPNEVPRSKGSIENDKVKLRAAWRRAQHAQQRSDEYTRAGILANEVEESTAEDRAWWLAMVDNHLGCRRRDVAYLLAGVTSIRRHADMDQLEIDNLIEAPDGGYRYELDEHKGARISAGRGGLPKPIIGYLDHVGSGVPCPKACPACRMSDHLEVRRRSGATGADPLFVGQGGEALGVEGGHKVVKRMAKLVRDIDAAEDGTLRAVGTRTLRVTGATLAREGGMSYPAIVEVMGSRSVNMARLYVRRMDAWSDEMILDLVDSRLPARGIGGQVLREASREAC